MAYPTSIKLRELIHREMRASRLSVEEARIMNQWVEEHDGWVCKDGEFHPTRSLGARIMDLERGLDAVDERVVRLESHTHSTYTPEPNY